jgi:hypothetical protein
MLKDYLPVFHVLEPQMLKGIYAGAIVAQRPVKYTAETKAYGVATVAKGDVKFIENGVIMTLDADGNLVNYATATGGPKMIHFTEELPTVLKAKDTWALKCTEGETYPRGILLQAGDEFVTDNVSGTISAAGYATVVAGILTVSTASTNAEFAAYPDTLPDGTDAYHFIVLK